MILEHQQVGLRPGRARGNAVIARMAALTRVAVAFSLAVAMGACVLHRSGRGSAGSRGADSVLVNVLNENYYAARIHADWVGGQRRSIGTVAGNGGRARVVIPWEPKALVFEILLVTDGSLYESQTVDVSPGESVELRVPSNISGSGLFRRVRR